MSIRFKFRSSVNFDAVDIGGRSSISVAELRAVIIRRKKLNVFQDFDLVFSDAVSGQEFGDHSTQIQSGSSVIIKRVPAGRAPSALGANDVAGNAGVKDSPPFNPGNDQVDRFDDLGAVVCSVPEAMVPGCAPEFDKGQHGSSEKADVVAPRIKGPKSFSSDANWDVPGGYDVSGDNEKIEEQMKLEKVTAQDDAPKEIAGLPSELKCSLCNTYFKEAVMIPCCQHSFCDTCIQTVLAEKARCPKCSSKKCKVEDLLPNLSLRQAIKHFLASEIPSDSPEIDLCKYAPDGESGIQVGDVSCAVTIPQRERGLPHSPSVTGKGSNQVMEEPFYSSFIRRNSLSGALGYRMSDLAAGREISTPAAEKVKDIPGGRDVHTHQTNVQIDPRDSDLTADYQGENMPINLAQPYVHDEAYSTSKRKRSMWVETEGGDGNIVAGSRPNKVTRTCYMCGSPSHLIRDCPVIARRPHPMLQTGPGMVHGGFPGYASSYWNSPVFPPLRPFPSIYRNPEMMPFSASAVPMTCYGAPPYVPSAYSALASPRGIMRMGTMVPPAGIRVKHPLSHPENLGSMYCEKMKELPNENLHRGQNRDKEDDPFTQNCYQEPERRSEREASASHSGDSLLRMSHNHRHGKHMVPDAYPVDVRHEKRSCSSFSGRDQKPSSERADSGAQHMPNGNNKNGKIRCRHCQSSSRKHHERKGGSHDDSCHGHRHQSDRDVRWRIESNVGSYHKKQSSCAEPGRKSSLPGDRRKQPKGRDSGFECKQPSQSIRHTGEDLQEDRWQMGSGSDIDYRDDYFCQK